MWGVAGLTIAFVILAAVLLWILITSRTNFVIKALLISFVLWYGAVLYYTPGNIMGWGKDIASKDHLPDQSWVQSIIIKEPDKKNKEPGYIYFLVIVYQTDKKVRLTLDPRSTFTYKGNNEPRLYKIEYSKELHKKIAQIKRARARAGSGTKIFVKKTEGRRQGPPGEGSKVEMNFEILNPASLIRKDSQ